LLFFVAAMPVTMACIDECGVGVADSDCEWSGTPIETNLEDSDGELDAPSGIEDAVFLLRSAFLDLVAVVSHLRISFLSGRRTGHHHVAS